jgi:hypothetical protein
MRPIIKFRLNKALDKELLYHFLGRTDVSGYNFKKFVLNEHPSLKRNKKFISKYVEDYHLKHAKLIEKKKASIEKEWRKHEEYFFNKTSKLFNHKWPKGKYIAYVSICPINPRWIHNKTFTVFYKVKYNHNIIIVHELLHFMFYNYTSEKFPKRLNEDKKWTLSEIFNVILMNQEFLRKIYKHREYPYPDHKKYIPRFQRLYKKHENIHEFIKAAIKEVNK